MYPNPAKDHFTVEVQEGFLPQYIEIYDMNGKLVHRELIGKGVTSKMIYVHLKAGAYVVYLEDK
jgi:hypothetical protein